MPPRAVPAPAIVCPRLRPATLCDAGPGIEAWPCPFRPWWPLVKQLEVPRRPLAGRFGPGGARGGCYDIGRW